MLVSAALDRKLSWIERFKVRFHLLFCKACRNFDRQMTILHTAARRLAGYGENNADAPSLSSRARNRIKEALHQCEHNDDLKP